MYIYIYYKKIMNIYEIWMHYTCFHFYFHRVEQLMNRIEHTNMQSINNSLRKYKTKIKVIHKIQKFAINGARHDKNDIYWGQIM